MRAFSRRLACAAGALLFASACSGSGVPAGGALPASSNADSARAVAARKNARVEVRLQIPKRKKRAHYVSPSTQSISIAEGSTTLGTFNTTATSPKCKANNGGTICTFKIGVMPGGNRSFTVRTFDQPAGAGTLLSTGSVNQKIVAGLNIIPITLSGVVASIAVSVQNPSSTVGTKATDAVTVMAQDADGNTIVGPGNYSVPITLTNSDASGVTTLSTTTVPGPGTRIFLNYTGANFSNATIGATASGVPSTSVTPGRFTPTPVLLGSFNLPTNIGSATSLSLQPIAITGGPDGNLWVSAQDSSSTYQALMRMTTTGTFTTFVPGVAPSTALPNDAINGLVTGSDGKIWYAADNNVGNVTTGGVATNYPLSAISGLCTDFDGERIIRAQDGGLWMTVQCDSGSQLLHVTTTGVITVNALPASFENATGLVLAKDNNVYIAGYNGGTTAAILRAIVAGAKVTSTATVLAAGVTTGALGIAQSADGDIWATSDGCDQSVLIRLHLATGFSAGSLTNIPTQAGCQNPAFITALPDDSLWVAENGSPDVTQVIPGATGGTPSMFDLAVPSQYTIYGDLWDAAAGPDGNVYFTNSDTGLGGFSANVVKVAY
jgi:hypothetical protein